MDRNKSRLQYLRRLVSALTLHERKVVRQFLSCFDPNFSDVHRVKTRTLFDLLTGEPQLPEAELCRQLYGKTQVTAFKFVRLRLIEKIHECLLLEINTSREELYSPAVQARTQTQKKLLQVQLLDAKGLAEAATTLLPGLIRQAKKYELYAEWAQALLLLQTDCARRDDWKAHEKLEPEIAAVLTRSAQLQAGQQALRRLQRACHLHCTPDRAALPEIAAPKPGAGIRLTYLTYQLRLASEMAQNNWAEASQHCELMIAHLRQQALLHTPENFRDAYLDRATIALHFGQPAQARVALRLARQHCGHTGAPCPPRLRELEAQMHLQTQRPIKVLELLRAAAATDLQQQRHNYLRAAALFQLQRFPEAAISLKDTNLLMADKHGWNLGIRILNMMLHVEMNRFDVLENSVDAFRKHLKRIPQQHKVSPRYSIILRIFQNLIRNDGDFAAVRASQDMRLLRTEPAASRLQPERVPFAEWIEEKAIYQPRTSAREPNPRYLRA